MDFDEAMAKVEARERAKARDRAEELKHEADACAYNDSAEARRLYRAAIDRYQEAGDSRGASRARASLDYQYLSESEKSARAWNWHPDNYSR